MTDEEKTEDQDSEQSSEEAATEEGAADHGATEPGDSEAGDSEAGDSEAGGVEPGEAEAGGAEGGSASSEGASKGEAEAPSADPEKDERPSQTEIVHTPRKVASWGNPIFKADVTWTKVETWLATVVLAGEILALSLWVVLKGMSTPADSESAAGVVFRGIFGALALGLIPYLALRKRGEVAQRWGAIAGVFLGIILAKSWVGVGVSYSSNLLNWYQQASWLTLFGGLRGIGTRLTLMLALLGGSLATARGKHITIDLLTRFISERLRLPIVLVGWLGAAVICISSAWGFFDHIAIENFGASADARPGEKIAKVVEELEEHAFVLRKQIALDLRSTPHIVFKGEVYAEWMTGKEWNEWVRGAGFVERYGAEAVESLFIGDQEVRSPIVVIPGKGEPRGELVNAANLVFPFGLLVIGLRFIMRSLLAISGHVSVDPEEGGEFSSDMDDAASRAEEAA